MSVQNIANPDQVKNALIALRSLRSDRDIPICLVRKGWHPPRWANVIISLILDHTKGFIDPSSTLKVFKGFKYHR